MDTTRLLQGRYSTGVADRQPPPRRLRQSGRRSLTVCREPNRLSACKPSTRSFYSRPHTQLRLQDGFRGGGSQSRDLPNVRRHWLLVALLPIDYRRLPRKAGDYTPPWAHPKAEPCQSHTVLKLEPIQPGIMRRLLPAAQGVNCQLLSYGSTARHAWGRHSRRPQPHVPFLARSRCQIPRQTFVPQVPRGATASAVRKGVAARGR